MTNTNWTQSEAIELCKKIEAICPKFGCHVALTGGLLYKEGERKDCDVLFYRIRQWKEIQIEPMWQALEKIGFVKVSGFGWCFKAVYGDTKKKVDCFFPEEEKGEYKETHDRNAGVISVAHDKPATMPAVLPLKESQDSSCPNPTT